MNGATCRSCGASIVWAITENGKRMPVDPQPTGDGNIEFVGDDRIVVHGQPPLHCPPLHVSHFATCPQADQHRRTR